MSEESTEREIQQKGLAKGPRVTVGMINGSIAGAEYHVFGGRLTVCCLTLRNGFLVTGESSCAAPENFDKELGERLAHDNARDKIWLLEGYRLRQRLYDEGEARDA